MYYSLIPVFFCQFILTGGLKKMITPKEWAMETKELLQKQSQCIPLLFLFIECIYFFPSIYV